MTILVSTILFSALLGLGWILMYINASYFMLIGVYLIYIILLKSIYRDPNCKVMEVKDFVATFIFTLVACFYMSYLKQDITTLVVCYLYLSSYIAILLFADSIRFKSLM